MVLAVGREGRGMEGEVERWRTRPRKVDESVGLGRR